MAGPCVSWGRSPLRPGEFGPARGRIPIPPQLQGGTLSHATARVERMTVAIDPSFDPVPSLARETAVIVADAAAVDAAPVRACFVASRGDLPDCECVRGYTRESLAAAGFKGDKRQTLLLPGEQLRVLVGVGEGIGSAAELRDAVAAFAQAASDSAEIAVDLTGIPIPAGDAALAAAEGAILARYRYDALKGDAKTVALAKLTLGVEDREPAEQGASRAQTLARATMIARDLSNTPPRHLTAERLANLIERLAPRFGLEVEVFDRAALTELGCGGLLGVNAGSADEPRMVKLSYRPGGDAPHVALVGKGIMYDSGGISLKPSNAMHALMKLDMEGAAVVFGAMTALQGLGSRVAVTGWLMCTDNMPSGSATKLGDVLTMRGGKTVEVKNTDAEGRLVLADGLVLATEEDPKPDAIVDIATLTGAAVAALGEGTAAMLANDDAIAGQLEAAAEATDERIWRLPLDHRYREQLKSNVADMANIGGTYAGTILAALFLNEFVGDAPWGHLDIAGTMHSDKNDRWRPIGATGFGVRLLSEFVEHFEAPTSADG